METWINTLCDCWEASLGNERRFTVPPSDEFAAYQLVGGVMAHQGYDG
jgi:hypothetical protein